MARRNIRAEAKSKKKIKGIKKPVMLAPVSGEAPTVPIAIAGLDIGKDLTAEQFVTDPNGFLSQLLSELVADGDPVTSVLDVQGGGGIYAKAFWENRSGIETRATCAQGQLPDAGPAWECKSGVDPCQLSDSIQVKADVVQCVFLVPYVYDPKAALEQLCLVANRLVFVTTIQRDIKALFDLGFTTRIPDVGPVVAWKALAASEEDEG
jgi:hypothetical protein